MRYLHRKSNPTVFPGWLLLSQDTCLKASVVFEVPFLQPQQQSWKNKFQFQLFIDSNNFEGLCFLGISLIKDTR